MEASLPTIMEDGKVQISTRNSQPIIETEFGLRVTYDSDWAIIVTVPSSYYGVTCGLCGNFNEDPDDDMTDLDGTEASSIKDWASNWKVQDEDPACSDSCQGQKELYRTEKYCGIISKVSGGPLGTCHPTVSPVAYFNNCIHGMCVYRGDKDVLCQMVGAYATACEEQGITADGWRTLSGCGLDRVSAPGVDGSEGNIQHLPVEHNDSLASTG